MGLVVSAARLGVVDRIPDDGRSDWFELVRTRDWAKGRVVLVGDAASGQPPFLGQGGGCAMMSAFTLAEALGRAEDVSQGIAEWKRRERRFTEWVQQVSYRYGQLALLSPGARTAAFRMIDRQTWLKDATLLVAARHDPAAPDYWNPHLDLDRAFLYPLVH